MSIDARLAAISCGLAIGNLFTNRNIFPVVRQTSSTSSIPEHDLQESPELFTQSHILFYTKSEFSFRQKKIN
ncbi:hypothetical protein M0802_009460 [Mischocyttarus mexicanus]|nr:hypothetical protein M0802_009460 [Mischocyttarus mexicanus]